MEKPKKKEKEEDDSNANSREKVIQKLLSDKKSADFLLTGYCYEKQTREVELKLLKEKYKKRAVKEENLKDREKLVDYILDQKTKEGDALHFTQTIEQYE